MKINMRIKILIVCVCCTLIALVMQTFLFQKASARLISGQAKAESYHTLENMQNEIYTFIKHIESSLIEIYNNRDFLTALRDEEDIETIRGEYYCLAYTIAAEEFETSDGVVSLYLYTAENDIISTYRRAVTPKHNYPKDIYEDVELYNAGFSGNREIQQAIEQNRYISENTWGDAWTIDQYECDKRFAEGRAAMYLTGTWSLQSVEQYTDNADFGLFPYPIGKEPRLIKEINMTYMMSSRSEYQQMIEEIFSKLISDEDLMQEILGFTQTYSIVEGIESGYQSNVQEDIDQYEANECTIGADAGNAQLVWNFQSDFAAETMKWMQGERTLEELLQYADDNRTDS